MSGDDSEVAMQPDAYARADVAIDLAQRHGMGLRLAVAAAIVMGNPKNEE